VYSSGAMQCLSLRIANSYHIKTWSAQSSKSVDMYPRRGEDDGGVVQVCQHSNCNYCQDVASEGRTGKPGPRTWSLERVGQPDAIDLVITTNTIPHHQHHFFRPRRLCKVGFLHH